MTSPIAHRLPNLVIAGVGKSGTSSLFAYLSQHPDIAGSLTKETHYFSPLRTGGELAPLARYASYFAHATTEPFRLEASPDYCVGGEPVISALRTTLDHPRVLILLRDPVERLWDNYWYMRHAGRVADVASFDEYVDRGLALREQGIDVGVAVKHSGWARSFYGDFLEAWLDAFDDDLRVLFFDDLVRDPHELVSQVVRWLGLPPPLPDTIDYGVHNPTLATRSPRLQRLADLLHETSRDLLDHHPRAKRTLRATYTRVNGRPVESHPPMSSTTRARLEDALAPSLRRTHELLAARGYDDLPPWLVGGSLTSSTSR